MQKQGIFRYQCFKYLFGIVFALAVLGFCDTASAATITSYSDRLSNSAPAESSNHTINFTTTVAIPAGGYIRYVPDPGDFEIPASVDFDIDNVALYVATSSGYSLRTATATVSAIDDGVSITTGTSGNIEITLNSTEGVPAGANLRLLIGSHTPNATTTDIGITNPNSAGTFDYVIRAGDITTSSQGRGRYAIVDKVHIDDVDTRETDAPVRFNGAPSGTISGTTLSVEFSLETDEFAKCRYSTASGTPYFSMGTELSTSFVTVHSKVISVATNTAYVFYVRCIDDEGNENTDDYEISFTVPEYPEGAPGGTGQTGSGGAGGE